MFKEKTQIEKNKISLGLILEYHKITWPFACMYFMIRSNCINQLRMALMSAFFGTYGILWVIKSNTFYDKIFYLNKKYHYNPIIAAVNSLSISIYFLFPWTTAKNCRIISPIEVFVSCSFLMLGGFLHYSSDAQKYYTLKYNPKHLITEDLYSFVQHPNYSGEFLMWMGLIIISGYEYITSYIPILWLYLATICVGIPEKAKSLKKYEDYEKWSKNTYKLIPYIY